MTSGATTRNLLAPMLRWGYRLRVHGAHHCPRRGPLLVVAPHLGFLDATALATCLPRPVDVLVDAGALSAVGARLPGRIVVDEADPAPALRRALERLRAGGAVGAWSGGGLERAAGYLALRSSALRSSALVLPAVVFGGSGRHAGDPPAWRSEVHVVVGEPFEVTVDADPLRRSSVLQAAEWVRQRVTDHAQGAAVRTGRLDGVALTPDGAAPDNGPS